ncbi:hypothetical protein Ciccas_006570 [Cichlidogyrus casuarinus]|uniref:P/Homo B domain-containing protein n=1 Tax=Cichlidogyrus casuarinus TaxID=1844966 RepID=A0ABD2Q5J8_9PLAT
MKGHINYDPTFKLKISKRSFVDGLSKRFHYAEKMVKFNDPNALQWQYLNTHHETVDINVYPVYVQNITGRGVVNRVMDDALDINHPDLEENYEARVSLNLCEKDLRNNPRGTNGEMTLDNLHGTMCAGIISSVANNSICTHGIAYNSRVGAVRMLCEEGTVSFAVLVRAVTHAYRQIDTSSSSWGPTDDGKTTSGPTKRLRDAYDTLAFKGRGGKGVINVFAGGNGAEFKDNCGADGYINYPWAISVAALGKDGTKASYSEACAAIRIAVPVGRDLKTTSGNSACSSNFTGTSAGAPLLIGSLALILETRPDLTLRDIMHILTISGRLPRVDVWNQFSFNAAGLLTSTSMGSGLLDIALGHKLAKNWKNVGKMCEVSFKSDQKLPLADVFWTEDSTIARTKYMHYLNGKSSKLPIKGKKTLVTFRVKESNCTIEKLENVIISLKINHGNPDNLEISLISPSGTDTVLLYARGDEFHKNSPINYEWTATGFYGENPNGRWTVIVRDRKPLINTKTDKVRGRIEAARLTIQGTALNDSAYERNKQLYDEVLTKAGKERRQSGKGHRLTESEAQQVFREQVKRYFDAFE